VHELQDARGASLTTDPAGSEPLAAGAGAGAVEPTRKPRRFGLLVFVAVLVVLADLASKALVVATLAEQPPVEVLGRWLRITYTRNPGAAFSIGTGVTIVFSVIAVVVVVVILRVGHRLRSVGWAVALGGVLGGAIGNLVDRLFREPAPFRGHVVDWIAFPSFPVFNLADSAIVCSAVLMFVLSLRGIGLDGTRAGHGEAAKPHHHHG
jgi:signal peptidase II